MSALSTQEVRIRLEGQLELLELALPRYSLLERLLKGAWRRHAIEQRALIEEVRREEEPLDAALETIRKLAEREGLPTDAVPLRLASELETVRKRLSARLVGRLGPLTSAPVSWREGLDRLLELATAVRLPGPDELVVLEGTAARSLPLWLLALVPSLAALAAYGGLAATGVLVSMICLGLAVLPLGKYTLLADRLVWVPYRGEPLEIPHRGVHVELHQHNTGLVIQWWNISTAPRGGVEGAHRLALPVVTSPIRLAALLMLYRDGPLKAVSHPPSGTALVLSASVNSLEGVALLHSRGVCFLPRGTAPELLKRIAHTTLEVSLSEQFLLEQLTRLPDEALAAALAVANEVKGGFYRTAEQVQPERSGIPSLLLRLRVDAGLVDVQIGGVDLVALRTLFPWTQDQTRQVP